MPAHGMAPPAGQAQHSPHGVAAPGGHAQGVPVPGYGMPAPHPQNAPAAQNPYVAPPGQQGYGGPYGAPPAQGFGAGYVAPPIQPPQAAEQPSTLHKVGGGIIALLTLGLTLFWMITEGGLYLLLSAVQADMFDGEYYPAISFFLTWMGLLFPLLPVWLGIVSAIEGRNAFRVAFQNAMRSWNQ